MFKTFSSPGDCALTQPRTHNARFTPTHTHTHTQSGICGLRGLSIGVMVFILYKLYMLLPYTYPRPKLSPHRRLCAFLEKKKKTPFSMFFFKPFGSRDIGSVLINHLHAVIPMLLYRFYFLINHIYQFSHMHTHTHTQANVNGSEHSYGCGSLWTAGLLATYLNGKEKAVELAFCQW